MNTIEKKTIIQYILVIICIIFGLIYLEIIELNFCNLNFNIKKTILKRGKKEDLKILDKYSNIDSSIELI